MLHDASPPYSLVCATDVQLVNQQEVAPNVALSMIDPLADQRVVEPFRLTIGGPMIGV